MVMTEQIRQALNDAYREGRERGGLACCGTTGVWHLPLCLAGRPESIQPLADWLDEHPHLKG